MLNVNKTLPAASSFLISVGMIAALLALTATGTARAQPYPVPDTWGRDFWSRPRLTGDWGGFRDELGKKGVVFDVDILSTPQTVLSGGQSTGGTTWTNADYTLNIDTDKLGLWPGGFFRLQADTGFGTNVYRKSGAIVPVNTAALFPAPNDHTTALTNATFIQFLSEKFGVLLGKVNTMVASPQEFYGDYNTQFLNAAFNFPMTLQQVPLSAYGGGLISLPAPGVTLSVLALDANGSATSNSLSDAFNNGTMLVGSGQITIKPSGLIGHQNFGFSWSNKDRYSLEQDPSNLAVMLLQTRFPRLAEPGPVLERILARFFPQLLVPVAPANHENRSWSVNYALDQYLWQPAGDSKRGIGVFLAVGASDGNPNPIKYTFVAGVGGKGVPGRPEDSFGAGISRTQFSDAFLSFLRQRLDLGLEHEDALEAYYSLALTGWLTATADIQFIRPGLQKSLNMSGSGLVNVDAATIAGIRIRVRL